MNAELVNLLPAITGLKVLVLGEAMLDCYLHGFSDRLCPEAPVPVVTVTEQQQVPGGAANTAVNVQTLGGRVTFLSVIGDDWEGTMLRQALEAKGVSTEHILTQPGRQTLTKQRVMARSQLLVRFDRGDTEAIAQEIEQALIQQLVSDFNGADAIIVSDYSYGILTPGVIATLAKLQQSSPRVLVVDSKRLTAYRSLQVTAVKPNYNEAIQLLGLKPLATTRVEQIASHEDKLLELTGAKIAAITLDTEGAIVFERDRHPYRTYTTKAHHSRAAGAGDTYVSALTLALAARATTAIAAELASAAAVVVVSKEGTTACSAQELRQLLASTSPTGQDKYILEPDTLMTQLTSCRAAGKRIVFTNGCFDILHAGHVSYLNRARSLGDVLIIGVNSDASISRIKGSNRPINLLDDRIQVLAALSCVDYLIPFEEDTPINLIQLIQPDVYVKGGDYTKETLPEAPIVQQLGGTVEILPFLENRSTTSIIERCQKQSAKQ